MTSLVFTKDEERIPWAGSSIESATAVDDSPPALDVGGVEDEGRGEEGSSGSSRSLGGSIRSSFSRRRSSKRMGMGAAENGSSNNVGAVRKGWSHLSADAFNVRQGPNYAKTGAKAPSGAALYELLTVDLFHGEKPCKMDHIVDQVRIGMGAEGALLQSPHPDVPTLFVVNCQLPQEAPSLMRPATDGPTLHCVMYFCLTAETIAHLRALDSAPPGVRLLVEYCAAAVADPKMRHRLKIIGSCVNLPALGLPSMFDSYNGKPCLITKSGSLYKGCTSVFLPDAAAVSPTAGGGGGAMKKVSDVTYMEMDVNMRHWAYLARKGMQQLQPRFPSMEVRVGFVIEAREDKDLDEVVLGCAALGHLDASTARHWGVQGGEGGGGLGGCG